VRVHTTLLGDRVALYVVDLEDPGAFARACAVHATVPGPDSAVPLQRTLARGVPRPIAVGAAPVETLARVVLSYTDVIALDASLSIRWIARDVAIDGLTGADGCALDDVLIVHAEMDPPGGWFDVALDARTGREFGRTPSLSAEDIAPTAQDQPRHDAETR